MLLSNHFRAAGSNERAFARDGKQITLLFQLVVRAFCGDYADAQVLCQRPNGWQRVVGLQFAGNDLFFDLPHNLHAQVYCDIIHAGKHFLGGKPFGIDKAANDQILQAIREH